MIALCISLVPTAHAEFFGAISGGVQTGQLEGAPVGLYHVDPELPQVLWVDLSGGAMYVLEQSQPGRFRQSQIIPVSIGKAGFGKLKEGDLRTPVGVYQVTSYLSDRQLADKYGHGAYPLNYPNIVDRLARRTGSGIWLHGLPKGVESRPALDSDGCVVIDNHSLDGMDAVIRASETLVVLAPTMQWQADPPSNTLMTTLEQWRQDWQNIDNSAYLAHYAEDFTDTRRNLKQWKQYKTRVNNSKKSISVSLSKLSAVAYPGEENLASVRFYQTYESDNYRWQGWKQLLWRLGTDGQWRIVYEGNG